MLPGIPFFTGASRDGDTLVITLTGELDITNRATLAEQLSQALGQQPAQLVYDLTEVPFIDAGTLRLLIQAGRRMSLTPVLARPAPIVARLLHVTGLDAECTVTASLQPASRLAFTAEQGGAGHCGAGQLAVVPPRSLTA